MINYPFSVIACHLPFSFRKHYYSFNSFRAAQDLEALDPSRGSHATIYRPAHLVFPQRKWRTQEIKPSQHRALLVVGQPLFYPLNLLNAVDSKR